MYAKEGMKAGRVEQLENAILELGTELYRLKVEVEGVRTSHEHFLEIVNGLKMILDEKGLINREDFEGAIDLGQALSLHPTFDGIESEINQIKKVTH